MLPVQLSLLLITARGITKSPPVKIEILAVAFDDHCQPLPDWVILPVTAFR
jgi:hypothetical protein